jgi:hypothetical protein
MQLLKDATKEQDPDFSPEDIRYLFVASTTVMRLDQAFLIWRNY